MITVTLNQIKNTEPCKDGWKKVLKANGGVKADMDKPFPLVSILDSNNLDDTLWVINNVYELEKYDTIWCEFARWCALQNIEKIKPHCSESDYKLILEWLNTGNEDLRDPALSIARSSAYSVADSAVWSTAWSVAWSAVRSEVESAAHSASRSVRSAQSAQSEQENKLRELLNREDK